MNSDSGRPDGNRPGDRSGDHRVYITDKPRDERDRRAERGQAPAGSRGAAATPVREGSLNMALLFAFVLFGIVLITFIAVFALSAGGRYSNAPVTTAEGAMSSAIPVTEESPATTAAGQTPAATTAAPAPEAKKIYGINSDYAVLMDAATGAVIAEKNSDAMMYPASLTKIMTLIVARERISDLDSTVTFTRGMLYSLELDAMKVGYQVGERASAIDLMYGAMLPSGCDATVGLAYMCASDEAAFAGLMNEKALSLGLTRTHFANSSGLHDRNNYTTAHELATIFAYALGDELMRKIICTDSYTTSGNGSDPATRHKLTDRLFLNMREYDSSYGAVKLRGFTMLGGKTGYVDESGSCLASYAMSDSGRRYIVVTGSARNMAAVLADHYNILMKYAEQ